MTCWQVVQDFRQSHKSILITASSNNIKLGARGFKCRPLKVVQDFFHQQYWNSMCLGEELQRISGQKLKDVLAICIFACQIINLWIQRSSSKVHVDLTILQHKLGRAALACRKTVAAPGERRKQNPFQRSMWKWPVLRGSPTQHYTLHYTQHYTLHCTQHYRTPGRGSILELSCFEGMKWKYKSVFLSWPEMLPLAAFR